MIAIEKCAGCSCSPTKDNPAALWALVTPALTVRNLLSGQAEELAVCVRCQSELLVQTPKGPVHLFPMGAAAAEAAYDDVPCAACGERRPVDALDLVAWTEDIDFDGVQPRQLIADLTGGNAQWVYVHCRDRASCVDAAEAWFSAHERLFAAPELPNVSLA